MNSSSCAWKEASLEERAGRKDFASFPCPHTTLGTPSEFCFGASRSRSWAPQILHAHDGRGQSLAWLASLGLPVRRVASRRVTFFPSDRWTYRLKYGRTCHAVVAVSENICELSVQAGVPRERITVIPDGIEIPAQLPSATTRQHLRSSWQCGNDDFVVGLLGASTAEKGQDLAIAASTYSARNYRTCVWFSPVTPLNRETG